jgi:MFS transporter, PHS family, inorganic phosphate transporter
MSSVPQSYYARRNANHIPKIPAETFPTPFRATSHGISAAAGKLGSIIVLSFLPKANFGSTDAFDSPRSDALGKILLVFCVVMALGGLVSWAWIPELQEPWVTVDSQGDARQRTWPSKTLEELARGRERGG